jgi:hypothetical protein
MVDEAFERVRFRPCLGRLASSAMSFESEREAVGRSSVQSQLRTAAAQKFIENEMMLVRRYFERSSLLKMTAETDHK